MAAVDEQYVPCVGYGVKVDTADWANVEDGGFDYEVKTDETTNNGGQGFYEDCPTIKKASGTIKVAYKNAAPPVIEEGKVYPLVIDGGAGAPYLSCNARFSKASYPVLSVQNAVHVTYTWASQGPVVRTRPTPP